MEHIIHTSPAYDDERYGKHPLEIYFIARNPSGALCFTVVTGWYIDTLTRARNGTSGSFFDLQTSPYCRLSFHAPATLANSVDSDPHENCRWLDGDMCQAYEPFGCTGKPIGDLFLTLVTHGIDRLWEDLDRHHAAIVKDLT